MKNYSKLLSIILVLVLSISMSACGSEPAQETSMDVSTEPAAESQTTESSESEDTDQVEEEASTGALEESIMAYFENMPDHIYKIKQDAFIELVKSGEDMTVLDIRSVSDYAEGHVQGPLMRLGEQLQLAMFYQSCLKTSHYMFTAIQGKQQDRPYTRSMLLDLMQEV